MSLLTNTQGTPERVWSLLRLLSAFDRPLGSAEIRDWLNPSFRTSGRLSYDKLESAVSQVVGAANGLGLIEAERPGLWRLAVALPDGIDGFAELVHERLAAIGSDNADAVMLDAYGTVAALCEKEGGTLWLSDTREQVAHKIDLGLRASGDEERKFNDTKLTVWTRWMVFLGLAALVPVPGRRAFYPYPAGRLERLMVVQQAAELGADGFLGMVAARLPYLDGGGVFLEACRRIGVSLPQRTLSRVLSGSLRDLHEDGRIALSTLGDATGAYFLSRDSHGPQTMKTIRLLEVADE